MKKAIRLLAVAAALFVGTAGAADALWGTPKGAGTMVPAQTNPASEKVLTVTFNNNGNGGTDRNDNLMKTAVDGAWTTQGAALGGDKTAVTKIALTGTATAVTGWNWKYLKEMFWQSSEWNGLKTLDMGGMLGVTEIKDETNNYNTIDQLTSVTLPPNLKTLGEYAFYNCESLTDVKIPAGVTSIGYQAFELCRSLTSIEIPSGVTAISQNAFNRCINLSLITVKAGNSVYSSSDGMLLADGGKTLYLCPEGKSGNVRIPAGVTSIGEYAFSSCESLTSVKIPAGVTSIGESAFSYCNSLTSMEIPVGMTSIVIGTFSYCNNLTSVKIPMGVTSIGDSAFSGCLSLTSVEIPMGVTSIGDSAFFGCLSLTSVKIPNTVTSIGVQAFYDCMNLTGITLAVSGDYTLSDIGKIGSVTIPDGKEITKAVVKSGGTLTVADTVTNQPEVTLEAGGTVVNNSGRTLTVTLPGGTTKSLAAGESLTGTAPPPPVSSEPDSSQPEVSSVPVSSRPEPVGDPGPLDENGMRLAGRAEQFAVLSGNGAVWNGNGSLELRIGAPLARFRELQWNGTVLRQGTDFTLREGSTVITLLPAWLETLPAGTHYVSAIFEGGRAELEFTVAASLGGVTSDGAGTPPTANPETGVGESAAVAVLVLAALLCGGALLAVLTRKKRSR